eukprot:g1145.t1
MTQNKTFQQITRILDPEQRKQKNFPQNITGYPSIGRANVTVVFPALTMAMEDASETKVSDGPDRRQCDRDCRVANFEKDTISVGGPVTGCRGQPPVSLNLIKNCVATVPTAGLLFNVVGSLIRGLLDLKCPCSLDSEAVPKPLGARSDDRMYGPA